MIIYNESDKDERMHWLDIAKGISILFIVLGHSSKGFLGDICCSFNSVIFFVLSGITFCRTKSEDSLLSFDNRRAGDFFNKIAKTLILPYFVWGMVALLVYFMLGNVIFFRFSGSSYIMEFSIPKNILGLLYGNSKSGYFEYYTPLWFLSCLVVVEILWFLILSAMYRIAEKKAWLLYGICMCLFLFFGIAKSIFSWDIIWPFEAENAIFLSFFFGIGLLLRSKYSVLYYEKIINKNFLHIYINIFLWLVVGVVGIYLNGHTDLRTGAVRNIGLFIFNALWVSIGIIYFSIRIQEFPLMEYIGKRTLAILVLHKYPIMFFKLFPFIQARIEAGNIIVEITVTVLSVLFSLIAESIISKFLPQLFGNSKKKK